MAVLAVVLAAAVVLMAARVGDQVRFVSWPVVAFTALAAAVAVVGLWIALPRPSSLAIGLLPALVVSYVLPAAPMWFVALGLLVLGGLALNLGGPAAGMATFIALAMVALVVLQGPAVECLENGVSSSSGPWWVGSPGSSSGSASGDPGGDFDGSTQVGDHHYAFRCEAGELVSFERID